MTPEKIKTLPKWAQEHIAKLEADIIGYRRQLDSISKLEGSRIAFRKGIQEERGLPMSTIVFYLFNDERIEINLDHDRLTVQGDTTVVIEPRAANAFHIRLDKP